MTSLFFHLVLTFGVIWYQRHQGFRPRPLVLAAYWYVVSAALVLIEAFVVTGRAFSGLTVQGLVLGLFYLPPVFLSLQLGRRWHDGLWRPFLAFLGLALVATVLAAVCLAYAPWAQGFFY